MSQIINVADRLRVVWGDPAVCNDGYRKPPFTNKPKAPIGVSTIKQFHIKAKNGREKTRPFFTLPCPQGIVCYTVFYFQVGHISDVCACAQVMLLALLVVMLRPMVASDVMFAHCAEGTTSFTQ